MPLGKATNETPMISEEGIKKFQELYKKHFGEEISTEKAHQSAAKLLRLIQIIYKPMTAEEFEKVMRFQDEIRKEFPSNNEG